MYAFKESGIINLTYSFMYKMGECRFGRSHKHMWCPGKYDDQNVFNVKQSCKLRISDLSKALAEKFKMLNFFLYYSRPRQHRPGR